MQETISNLQNAVSKNQISNSRYCPSHFTKYLPLTNLPISTFNDINSLRFAFLSSFSKQEAREILKNKKSLKIFVLRRLRFVTQHFAGKTSKQQMRLCMYACMNAHF